MICADDGFGNMVPIDAPYVDPSPPVKLYTRIEGVLCAFESDACTHTAAITALRQELGHCWDVRRARYIGSPVLALIKGGS